MARKIKTAVAILNIRLHPHDASRYAAWLMEIFSRKTAAHVHGDRYGVISTLDKREAGRGVLSGVITTFVRLDDTGTWFNYEQMGDATEEQISEIRIPGHLYPNSAAFYFYFDTVTHRIYFQTYSKGKTLTPKSALRFFSGLSQDLSVMADFGEAKISIVQDRASLDHLFGLKRIKTVQITILKPNTDIFDDDFEQKVEAHLAETHSKQIAIAYKADAGASIVPTQNMRRVGEVALENGNIEVTGRDDKGAVTLSSDNFPLVLQDTYDPDALSEKQAFLRLIPARSKAAEQHD